MDNLPAIQPDIVERGNFVSLAERVVAHQRVRRQVNHFITIDFSTLRQALLRRFDSSSAFSLLLRLDLAFHLHRLRRGEDLIRHLEHFLVVAHRNRDEEFVTALVAEFDQTFGRFEARQPFVILGHQFVEGFAVAHFYEIVDLRHGFLRGICINSPYVFCRRATETLRKSFYFFSVTPPAPQSVASLRNISY